MGKSRKEVRAQVNKLLSCEGQGSSEDRESSVCDLCCLVQLSPRVLSPFPCTAFCQGDSLPSPPPSPPVRSMAVP